MSAPDGSQEEEHKPTLLQEEVVALKRQMAQMSIVSSELEHWVEDTEGRSRHSNICVLGYPKQAEGESAETFLENWILKELCPQGLLDFLVVE
ncbi:hypothetical protein NDU88_001805 [Pleurodeles waltl]|uniref:Uncharacterized protein n=1 Tax=Pleurodeles waltl TaxID=8319 RepID=A0AAV7VAU1_PLEWA|nr:hypothetical protein NDU88_001805 [Pleurodeles waltl]